MNTALPSAQRPFLPALSAIRFVPALAIAGGHILVCWRTMAVCPPAPVHPDFARWCTDGVSLFAGGPLRFGLVQTTAAALGWFFQISGFILAYIYLHGDRPTQLDLRAFWVARVARVYPVYFLALVFGFPLFLINALGASGHPLSPSVTLSGLTSAAAAAVFLLQAWWPRVVVAWNGPGWSLSCEALYYLLFPLTAWAVDRLRPRGLLALFLVCWVVSLVPPSLYVAFDPDHIGNATWLEDGYWLRVVKFNPLIRLPEFLGGVALGKLWLMVGPSLRGPAGRRLGSFLSCTGLGLALLIGAFHVVLGIPYFLVHNGLLDLLFGMATFGLALGGGPLQWILERRPLVLLGDATFTLYILHIPAEEYVLLRMAPYGTPWMHPAVFYALFLTCAVPVVVLVHQWFEVPARHYIRRRFLRPRQAPPLAVPAPG